MERALNPDRRKEAAVNDWLRQCVDEAFADPRPKVSARNDSNGSAGIAPSG